MAEVDSFDQAMRLRGRWANVPVLPKSDAQDRVISRLTRMIVALDCPDTWEDREIVRDMLFNYRRRRWLLMVPKDHRKIRAEAWMGEEAGV